MQGLARPGWTPVHLQLGLFFWGGTCPGQALACPGEAGRWQVAAGLRSPSWVGNLSRKDSAPQPGSSPGFLVTSTARRGGGASAPPKPLQLKGSEGRSHWEEDQGDQSSQNRILPVPDSVWAVREEDGTHTHRGRYHTRAACIRSASLPELLWLGKPDRNSDREYFVCIYPSLRTGMIFFKVLISQ